MLADLSNVDSVGVYLIDMRRRSAERAQKLMLESTAGRIDNQGRRCGVNADQVLY